MPLNEQDYEEVRQFLRDGNRKDKEADNIYWIISDFCLSVCAMLVSAYIFIDSSRYHQDRDAHAYPELSFLGSDDPIVGAMLLCAGVSAGYSAYLGLNIVLESDARAKGLNETAQKNTTLFWGLMCVFGLYGIIRFGIGLLGPDNDASVLSSMGDSYHGETIDLAKALSMAFLYSGMFVGSTYKLITANNSNSPKGPKL